MSSSTSTAASVAIKTDMQEKPVDTNAKGYPRRKENKKEDNPTSNDIKKSNRKSNTSTNMNGSLDLAKLVAGTKAHLEKEMLAVSDKTRPIVNDDIKTRMHKVVHHTEFVTPVKKLPSSLIGTGRLIRMKMEQAQALERRLIQGVSSQTVEYKILEELQICYVQALLDVSRIVRNGSSSCSLMQKLTSKLWKALYIRIGSLMKKLAETRGKKEKSLIAYTFVTFLDTASKEIQMITTRLEDIIKNKDRGVYHSEDELEELLKHKKKQIIFKDLITLMIQPREGTIQDVLAALYTCLGDIIRYKSGIISDHDEINNNLNEAIIFYKTALVKNCQYGKAYNQLAVVAQKTKKLYDASYYYIRALSSLSSFPAINNLISLYEQSSTTSRISSSSSCIEETRVIIHCNNLKRKLMQMHCIELSFTRIAAYDEYADSAIQYLHSMLAYLHEPQVNEINIEIWKFFNYTIGIMCHSWKLCKKREGSRLLNHDEYNMDTSSLGILFCNFQFRFWGRYFNFMASSMYTSLLHLLNLAIVLGWFAMNYQLMRHNEINKFFNQSIISLANRIRSKTKVVMDDKKEETKLNNDQIKSMLSVIRMVTMDIYGGDTLYEGLIDTLNKGCDRYIVIQFILDCCDVIVYNKQDNNIQEDHGDDIEIQQENNDEIICFQFDKPLFSVNI